MHGGLVGGLGFSVLKTRTFIPSRGGTILNTFRIRNAIAITPTGNTINGMTTIVGGIRINNSSTFGFGNGAQWGSIDFSGNIITHSCLRIGLGSQNGTLSTTILSDSVSDVLSIRNVANPQTFRVYRTTDLANNNLTSSPVNFERLELTWSGTADAVVGTVSGGTGSNRGLILRTAGTNRITIAADGQITIAEALNINTGTTTGTQLATSSTQKLGFWGATPVVRPAALADVTGGANIDSDCRATLNNLLDRLRIIGIITP